MFDGFERNFNTISQEQERKLEEQILTIMLSFKKQYSQQIQNQLPINKKTDNRKVPHQVEIPTSEEKSRKQAKNPTYKKSWILPLKMISYEQLVNFSKHTGRGKRLKKDNYKLDYILYKQEELDSKLTSQERDLNTFYSLSQNKKYLSQRQQQKQTEIGNRIDEIEENQQKLQLKMEIKEQKSDPIMIEKEIIRKPQRKQRYLIIRKKYFCCGVHDIYIGNYRNSRRKN